LGAGQLGKSEGVDYFLGDERGRWGDQEKRLRERTGRSGKSGGHGNGKGGEGGGSRGVTSTDGRRVGPPGGRKRTTHLKRNGKGGGTLHYSWGLSSERWKEN